ncbi:MAG: hypothetical protein AB7O68_07790 [Pirellulales bacterium]
MRRLLNSVLGHTVPPSSDIKRGGKRRRAIGSRRALRGPEPLEIRALLSGNPVYLPFDAGDGHLYTSFPVVSEANAVAIQADGKIVLAGEANVFALARYNVDGTLDTSFDGDGKVQTAIGTAFSTISAMAIQADGRIVVAGSAFVGAHQSFAVARYNSDGSLDTSFDGDGKVTTQFGSSADTATSMAIQADGKIVVAGYSTSGANSDFAVVRYNSNGSLDTSFDGDGIVLTPGTGLAYALAIQADGKILVGGEAGGDFALVRYNSDGSLDTSFDGDGKALTNLNSNSHEQINAIAVQADGKIVAVGYAHVSTQDNIAVVRYNSNGSLDTSFSDDGKIIAPTGYSHSYARAVAIQANGKILVAGSSFVAFVTGATTNSKPIATVLRYNSNGSLDSSFDDDGVVTTTIGYSSDANALALQSDGKIVIAGGARVSGDPSTRSFARARYLADGTLDAAGAFEFSESQSSFDLTSRVLATDPDGDSLTVNLDFDDDGSVEVTYVAAGGVAYGPLLDPQALGMQDGDISRPVRVSVSDGTFSVSYLRDFQVLNDAPEVSVAYSGIGDVNFTVNVTDIPADLAAGFTFEFDWNNDGTYDESFSGASGLVVSHTFADLGPAIVRVRVTDKDGGSTTQTVSLAGGFKLLADGTLSFIPTAGEDHVSFEQIGPDSVRAHVSMFNSESLSASADFHGVTKISALGSNTYNDHFDASAVTTIPVTFSASGPSALLIGGGADDYLTLPGDGIIYGGAGNDHLYYAAEMHGGAGDDTIRGDSDEGAGPSLIYGDDGNDTIYGDGHEGGNGPGNDTIYGGAGNDTIYADGSEGGYPDHVYGEGGDDYIVADGSEGSGPDYVDGGSGNDTIYGGGGSDTLIGGSGTNSIFPGNP